MENVLVVGATGQLGTAVVKKLRAAGTVVRAVVRSSASAPRFHGLGADTVMADLLQPATLASLRRNHDGNRNRERSHSHTSHGYLRSRRTHRLSQPHSDS